MDRLPNERTRCRRTRKDSLDGAMLDDQGYSSDGIASSTLPQTTLGAKGTDRTRRRRTRKASLDGAMLDDQGYSSDGIASSNLPPTTLGAKGTDDDQAQDRRRVLENSFKTSSTCTCSEDETERTGRRSRARHGQVRGRCEETVVPRGKKHLEESPGSSYDDRNTSRRRRDSLQRDAAEETRQRRSSGHDTSSWSCSSSHSSIGSDHSRSPILQRPPSLHHLFSRRDDGFSSLKTSRKVPKGAFRKSRGNKASGAGRRLRFSRRPPSIIRRAPSSESEAKVTKRSVKDRSPTPYPCHPKRSSTGLKVGLLSDPSVEDDGDCDLTLAFQPAATDGT
ncbi:unnamed protein product [Timema podura]|uniref:Uncharacterized protein n=1 Tax=Timema podura TaxID=61482 RepID=A0ABN7PM00_TIMPD|nr:unnamed protein product [Timema podura]